MFCPLTLYKQLIILHYNIDFVKSESTYEPNLFFKIIIQTLTTSAQSYGFIFPYDTSHHVIVKLCYIHIDKFCSLVLGCSINLRVYFYKTEIGTFPVVFVSFWFNQLQKAYLSPLNNPQHFSNKFWLHQ